MLWVFRYTGEVAGAKLLIVDPSIEAAKRLSEGLRKAGYQPTVVENRQAVWDYLSHSRPNLILSEIQLEDINGFELLRELRQRDEYAHLPFVFLSTEYSIDSKIHGLELQADDYIPKSEHVTDLIVPIEHVLERKRHEKLKSDFLRADDSSSGSLEETSVVDLLQAIESSKKSGVLTLSTKYSQGVLYFRNGEIVDARIGKLRGMNAMQRLLLCEQGSYLVQFRHVRRPNRINHSIKDLADKGTQKIQIWRALETQLPALESVLSIDTEVLAHTLADLPDHANATLKLIDGQRSIMKVIDDSPDDPIEVLKLITQFHQDKLVRTLSPRSPAATAFSGEKTLGWFPAANLPSMDVQPTAKDPEATLFQDTELDALTPSEERIPIAEPVAASEPAPTPTPKESTHTDTSPEPPAWPARPKSTSKRHIFRMPFQLPQPQPQERLHASPTDNPTTPAEVSPNIIPKRRSPLYVLALVCVLIGLGSWAWSQRHTDMLPEQGHITNRSLDTTPAAPTTPMPSTPMPEPEPQPNTLPEAQALAEKSTEPSQEDEKTPTDNDAAYQALIKEAKQIQYRNINRAIELYSQAIALNDNDSAAFSALALLYYTKNDYERTIEFAARAVTIDASNAEAWLALGAARQNKGDKAGSQEAYRFCTEQGKGPMVMECRRMIR